MWISHGQIDLFSNQRTVWTKTEKEHREELRCKARWSPYCWWWWCWWRQLRLLKLWNFGLNYYWLFLDLVCWWWLSHFLGFWVSYPAILAWYLLRILRQSSHSQGRHHHWWFSILQWRRAGGREDIEEGGKTCPWPLTQTVFEAPLFTNKSVWTKLAVWEVVFFSDQLSMTGRRFWSNVVS